MKRLGTVIATCAILGLGAAGFIVPEPEAAVGAMEGGMEPTRGPASTSGTGVADVPAAAASGAVAAAVREPALETFTGSASYYADRFEGRTTASGVPFRQAAMWAAHRTLPFGTRLRVTNVANGSEVEVEVVDRGPYAHGRVLDLSRAAARRLDFIRAGHTRVRVEVLWSPGR